MLHNRKRVPLPQVSRDKRREPLCSGELLYLLVSRLLVIRKIEETSLLAREERAVLYLILDKKKLRASFNLMRQTKKLQTGPSNFTRNKRAPFTPQSARRDLLSLQVREKDRDHPLDLLKRWKRACAKEEGWSSPQHQTKKSGPDPQPVEQKNMSSTSCSNTTRDVPPTYFW